MPSEFDLVYGLESLQSQRKNTLGEVGLPIIDTLYKEWNAEYERQIMELVDDTVQRSEEFNQSPVRRYSLPYGLDFQPVTEDGKADPVNNKLTYDIGLPLRRYELAAGESWEANMGMTVEDLSLFIEQMQHADKRSLGISILRALLYNQSWLYRAIGEDVVAPSQIPVLPLANGDSQVYPLKNGNLATAQHYTAQSAAVADANDPFPAIANTMNSYGFTRKMPNLVSFVNGSSLISGIKGLAAFQPVLDFKYINLAPTSQTIDNSILSQRYFGDKVLGEHESGITIVQWSDLPDNYIVTMDMNVKPVAMREHVKTVYRGLYGINFWSHYGNENHRRVRRRYGMGVVDRTAGHVHYVGSASYVVPAGYTPTA